MVGVDRYPLRFATQGRCISVGHGPRGGGPQTSPHAMKVRSDRSKTPGNRPSGGPWSVGVARLFAAAALLSTTPVVSSPAQAASNFRPDRSLADATLPARSVVGSVALMETARCDEAIQLPDGWTCHRGRVYRLPGLRVAMLTGVKPRIVR